MYKQVIFYSLILMACSSAKNDVTPVSKDPNPAPNPIVVQEFNATSCGPNRTEAELATNGWKLAWQDEFSTDLGQWSAWESGAFNNEYQFYKKDNLSIKEGVLKITSKREYVSGKENPFSNAIKNYTFTSGRIETKQEFQLNTTNTKKLRFIARLKMPKGVGMWPAFWSYGANWPVNGEIDFMEQDGAKPTEYSATYHYGDKPNVLLTRNNVGYMRGSEEITSCWHIYECIWEANKLTFLFDGKEFHNREGGYVADMFGKKQNVVLNLAVGGDFTGRPNEAEVKPGIFYADWVRIYSAE